MMYHSNDNSVLYFLSPGSLTANFSYFECDVACTDRLRCQSSGRVFYVCSRGQGIIWASAAVRERCSRVRFTITERECAAVEASATMSVALPTSSAA